MIILEVLIGLFFSIVPFMVAYAAYKDMIQHDSEEKFW
jgi:hypothetical protein